MSGEKKPMKCVHCGTEVVWMHTEKGKPILVNADSCYDEEARYDKEVNHCHYESCSNKPDQGNNIAPCRDCGAEIVWMTTSKGKKVMVDLDTYHDEKQFNSWVNKVHWETCPVALARKAEEEGTTPGVPPTDPALDLANQEEIPF